MSKSTTIETRRMSDGSLARLMPDGTMQPLAGKTDWARLKDMTEDEIMAAALSDPDNPPSTPESEARMKPVPRTKTMRRALKLTQEAFSARYHIPVETLRDWETGVTQPDRSARAYLALIASDPDGMARLLSATPSKAAAE